ncbi:MAG: hypothetical protein ACI83W_002048, partial [Marinoscillum sp.]
AARKINSVIRSSILISWSWLVELNHLIDSQNKNKSITKKILPRFN